MQTPRLTLEFCTLDHINALIEGRDTFERRYGLAVKEGYLEFEEALPWMQSNLEKYPAPWGSYLYIHQADRAVIGMGGYKNAPDSDGMVEIGYGVAYDYRNQGYASEAARAMIDYAFTHPEVQKVWAHTLAEPNFSTKVLERCGMTFIGSHQDPEDGTIWRWEALRGAAIK